MIITELQIVKNKNKYVNFDKINFYEIKYIYTPEINDFYLKISNKFTELKHVYTDDNLNNLIYSLVQNDYNCLKKNQDILLMDDEKNILYKIPYLYLKILESENLDRFLNNEHIDLISYIITKDLNFLNSFYKKYKHIDYIKINIINNEINGLINNCQNNIKYLSQIYEDATLNEAKNIDTWSNSIENTKSDRKNIIIIHLESISQLIYNTNINSLKNLKNLIDKSIYLNNFITSATSTLMTVASLFYGNDFELDNHSNYSEINITDTYSENIFKILEKNGYKTKGIYASNKDLEFEFINFNIWHNKEMEKCTSHKDLIDTIDSYLDSYHEPFALFLDNEFTHCGTNDDEIDKYITFEEKMNISYKSLDHTIEYLYLKLSEKKMLDNTIIIAYGDHGDDKWTRAINSGFSHSTEPYLSIVHTPAFIFDNRSQPFITNRLVSSIDIKYLILYILGIDLNDNFEYSGINICKSNNSEVFSSNLFANQDLEESIENKYIIKLNNFNNIDKKVKSYSITNNEFHLMVSTRGLEFYNKQSDPYCYNNLLNFFEFDEDGNATDFNNFGAWRGHFRIELMNDVQIAFMLSNFYNLKEKLYLRVIAKNSLINSQKKNKFDMNCFNKIRKRGFYYN